MQFHQNPQEATKVHLYTLEVSELTKANDN